ncbi:MAG TPA: Mut7-C RNAse domain-containing protein [Verrucomicrobiae bacterium]
MGRIQKAYETRFRWLLQLVHTRRLGRGVGWLVEKARRLSVEQRMTPADALTQVERALASRPAFQKRLPAASATCFFCDAGLGGLARWLRAAGYDARWQDGIEDGVLIESARELGAAILTTDSMLMERRVIRDRVIPAYWLPPTLSIAEQLGLVFQEFGLELRERRCMACGGELARADKETLRDRIPPRTYRWRDEYFLCGRCGKLFWHGTHWARIHRELQLVAGNRG